MTNVTWLLFYREKGQSSPFLTQTKASPCVLSHALLPPACVLQMSLRDSATAARFTLSVGGLSEIPVCGRWLLPCSLSVAYLSHPHSCHSFHCLPLSQMLHFGFCATLYHFVLQTMPVTQPLTKIMTDGGFGFLFLLSVSSPTSEHCCKSCHQNDRHINQLYEGKNKNLFSLTGHSPPLPQLH